MRLSSKHLWRTGFFVIKAMLTGGLVARRKALTQITEHPVCPLGWTTKGTPEMKSCFIWVYFVKTLVKDSPFTAYVFAD